MESKLRATSVEVELMSSSKMSELVPPFLQSEMKKDKKHNRPNQKKSSIMNIKEGQII